MATNIRILQINLAVVVLACLWLSGLVAAEETRWSAAKLKNNSVSYGQIASGGTGLTVEGKFTDTARVYSVLEEQGQFVKLSDGTNSGWVFRSNLEPVTDVAPADPDLENNPTTSRDPLIGQKVFYKDSAVAMVGSQVLDKYKVLAWPNRVGDVQGDWVWLGRAWVRRSEVMLLPEAFDYCVEEVRRNPQSAAAWRRRGNCWEEKGEHDNAIKDYDESLRLDPKDAVTWNNRGWAKSNKQDYDGAIRDYDEAIRLDPKHVRAWNNRGNAKSDKQDYDGAIRDYDEAIRLDPKDVLAWNNRGNAKSRKQDYDGAIRDYDEAIRLDPKYVLAWNNRGVTLMVTRQADAAASFDQMLQIEGWQGALSIYAVIFGCLDARLRADTARAQKLLADAEGKLKPDWPTPVMPYLQGQRSEAELLELASDNDKQTEAHCYIGLNHLAAGDLNAARQHLQWVRDNGNRNFVEYTIAVAELNRLDAASQSPLKSSPAQPKPNPAGTAPIRRVLTEASGDRQVTVDILSLDGQLIRVRTLDGKETTIDINRLSPTDRDWLKTKFPN